ncbi:hypothetical protein NEF87_001804 [Candidatus Lokiarchaeum ossiferum]|uniref:Dinitrogenase iron-molybdenum cofactor biosynthesis domain-containing protein n=1 Tax=Candidatus Lokiarchaeum ossiferum TaxID=2951803 RepID=A0ABY6HPS6_9ARCH|nr:hypothetical protein NEF87_001804 [Candidatus Lokiarchaeum sp. B-35]
MSLLKVAFPSTVEGLTGELVPHFGHTPAFTILEYDEESKEVSNVEVLQNAPHQQGGCMQPVMFLKNAGVNSVVLGGIGQRPLMGFLQVGVEPYAGIQGTVKENFEAFVAEKLQKMAKASCNH